MISVNKEKLEGIVLYKDNYKEDSLKITLLTIDGLRSFIVRGAKKMESKLRMLTQEFSVLSLVTTNNKVLNTVCEGNVIENFTNIKSDTYKTMAAMVLTETVTKFVKTTTEISNLYNLYLTCLKLINDYSNPNSVINIFHLKLLSIIGAQPLFKTCAKCQKQEGIYFSIKEGGLVCEDCHKSNDLSANLSQLIKIIYLIKLDVIDENFLKIISEYQKELENTIKDYYQTYFDYTNLNMQLLNKME